MKLRLNFLFLSLMGLLIATSSSAQNGLAPFQPESFKEITAQAGTKPLVVMIWSLDCAYCASSLQALARAKAMHGIEVVTIATDPFDDAEARQLIMEKLHSGGLSGPAWAFGPSPAAKLRYAIDPKWRGEVPRSYWYRNGRPVASHSGTVTEEITMKYLVK